MTVERPNGPDPRLSLLRSVDLQSVMRQEDIWIDSPCDVEDLHGEWREEFQDRLANLLATDFTGSPMGWVMLGSAGTGKTHLLSAMRRDTLGLGAWFIQVDMTDVVAGFWDTVLQGYLDSLNRPLADGRYMYEALLERSLQVFYPDDKWGALLQGLFACPVTDLLGILKDILGLAVKKHRRHALAHSDVLRALALQAHEDRDVAIVGDMWLRGLEIDGQAAEDYGFTRVQKPPMDILQGLSWLMSLSAPTVLAFDQVDSIILQQHYRTGAHRDPEDPEAQRARAIIESMAGGFRALYNAVTCRTLIVLSCIETAWNLLQDIALQPSLACFENPKQLTPIQSGEQARQLVARRLSQTYQAQAFCPPTATWPFHPEAFDHPAMRSWTPRELLRACDGALKSMLRARRIQEIGSLVEGESLPASPPPPALAALDDQFAQWRDGAAVYDQAADEQQEEKRLARWLSPFLQCLVIEQVWDQGAWEAEIQPLAGRLPIVRLIVKQPKDGHQEAHYCVAVLLRSNATAFQTRLRDAMTRSGIDRDLSFRHLTLVRPIPVPRGPKTQRMKQEFLENGGQFHRPTEGAWRDLYAMQRLWADKPEGFRDWLRQRQPASRMALAKVAVPDIQAPDVPLQAPPNPSPTSPLSTRPVDRPAAPVGNATTPGQETGSGDAPIGHGPAPVTAVQDEPPSTRHPTILLGLRDAGMGATERIEMDVALLEKHTVILAGSGSGKTVLIRRLVEDAALLGVPSIVIDVNNDLSTLCEPRPDASLSQGQDGLANGDDAAAYFAQTERVIWTPGRETANPIRFDVLPDFSATHNTDDRTDLVTSAMDTLSELALSGQSQKAKHMAAILQKALEYFAEKGGGPLEQFVELLQEPPDEALPDIQSSMKLSRELADAITSALVTATLYKGDGAVFDPGLLFGDAGQGPSGKTRLSIINLAGLEASRNNRPLFLNNLATALLTWLKKNPHPPRPLRGLLVVDEAGNFVPSVRTTPCKRAFLSLATQARKYHLGLIFATQNPKDLDPSIISNSSTHYYGKASAPVAIQVIQDQMKARHGSGDDIAMLRPGTFYVYSGDTGMSRPKRIHIPMCRSHHRPSPPDGDTIFQWAANDRRRLEKG